MNIETKIALEKILDVLTKYNDQLLDLELRVLVLEEKTEVTNAKDV